MYFYYRTQLGCCHSVFYVKAPEFIMFPGTGIRRYDTGDKTHSENISQKNRICPCLQHRREQIIIGRQLRKDSAAEGSAVPHQLIMVLYFAVFAAEPLVCPSIADLFAAVQALRHHSQFSFVPHDLMKFSSKYRHKVAG